MLEAIARLLTVRRAKTLTVLAITVASAAAVAATPASASDGVGATDRSAPLASSADEDLVRYLPPNRLKIGAACPPGSGFAGRRRCLIYYGTCTADCKVTVRSKIRLPGPDPRAVVSTGSFAANEVFRAYLVLNRPLLAALRRHRARSRLRTRLTATDLVTSETDVDVKVFRFRRG